jgi:hypothetical protein
MEDRMPGVGFGDGPYHLSPQALDSIVTRNCPGAFVLGESTEDGFHVDFVGRSDTDVNARLQHHVGKYRHFRFDYVSDPAAAFNEECMLYHDYRPGDNKAHPQPAAGSGWHCPRCRVFG